MQHIEKCTYVYVIHVFEVDYICIPQIPQLKVSWISFHNANTVRACLHGGWVTRLGVLPGLPGRVTLSAGVTICHVNVSRWGNPPGRGRVHGKNLKSEKCMISNVRIFCQNKNSLELLNIIFENSSPKGSFGANKKKVEFLLLSPDSWKLLTTSLT